MQVRYLGRENPLEEDMATHSNVFLPGESHGQRSLAGYSPWGHKESGQDLVTKQTNDRCMQAEHSCIIEGVYGSFNRN